MDPFNKEQTEKVWRRVLGNGGAQYPIYRGGEQSAPEPAVPPLSEELVAMLRQARSAAACYLTLSRRTGGRTAGILRRMYEEKQNHVDCLLGLYDLLCGKRPSLPPGKPPAQEPLETSLRRCYGEAMRALVQLEAGRDQPECGRIFARLAQQEQEHCRLLLELLGRNSQG